MAKRSKTRTLVTPTLIDLGVDGGFVATGDAKLEYWKRILPEDSINYTFDDGTTTVLDFTRESNQELIEAFKAKALDQTPFMLADKDNAHTMDPERYRADVVDMRLAREDEEPGLYGRIRFASKRAAKSVLLNPALGVSARIRPDVENARSGQKFKRAIIHVLGTLDPKVTGLGGWTPAVDLSSGYAPDDVLDLSGTTYAEASVPKIKRDGKTITPEAFAGMGEDEMVAAAFSEAEIAELVAGMTDEMLGSFIEANEHLADDADPEDDDESDDDESDDDESDDDESDAESGVDDEDREPVGAGVDMSNATRREIDLANARADEAQRNARRALQGQAESEWKAERARAESKGVPPWVLDLAKPALSGVDDYTVDLSNHGGSREVNMSSIVRKLVEGYEGTIDLSEIDLGHGDADGGDQYADDRAALGDIHI